MPILDPEDFRFDRMLLAMAVHHEGRVGELLDTIFSFLARKTDFYTGAEEGAAESLILDKFIKYQTLAKKVKKKKEAEETDRKKKENLAKAKAEEANILQQSQSSKIMECTSEQAEQLQERTEESSCTNTAKFKIETNEEINMVDVAPGAITGVTMKEEEERLLGNQVTIKEELEQLIEDEITMEEERLFDDKADLTECWWQETSLIKVETEEEISITDIALDHESDSSIKVELEPQGHDKEDLTILRKYLTNLAEGVTMQPMSLPSKDRNTFHNLDMPLSETKETNSFAQSSAIKGMKMLGFSKLKPVETVPNNTSMKENMQMSAKNEFLDTSVLRNINSENKVFNTPLNNNFHQDETTSNNDSDYYPPSEDEADESEKSGEAVESFPKQLKGNEQKIKLKQVKRKKGGRRIIKHKGHSCLFCHKITVNLALHFERVHKNELEVSKLLALEKGKKERREGFINLGRIGDYYHNMEVLAKGNGELILSRKPVSRDKFKYKNYTPCPHCLGFMLKKHLWHHAKNCSQKKSNSESDKKHCRKVLSESKILIESPIKTDLPPIVVEKLLSETVPNNTPIKQNLQLLDNNASLDTSVLRNINFDNEVFNAPLNNIANEDESTSYNDSDYEPPSKDDTGEAVESFATQLKVEEQEIKLNQVERKKGSGRIIKKRSQQPFLS